MALILQSNLNSGDVLLSLGELGRVLNLPESKLEKAVAQGVIQPIGQVGRNWIVAMPARDFTALDDAMKRLHAALADPAIPLPATVPELPTPNPAVLPNTFRL
jgi:hypothetical protein